METLKEWAPVANFVLIVVAFMFTVMTVKEALRRFENKLNKIEDKVEDHDIRLATIEAVSRMRHPGDI